MWSPLSGFLVSVRVNGVHCEQISKSMSKLLAGWLRQAEVSTFWKGCQAEACFRGEVGARVGWGRRSLGKAVSSRAKNESQGPGLGINLVSERPKEVMK